MRAESVTVTLVYTYNVQGLRVAQSVDGDVSTYAWDWASGLPEMLSEGENLYLVGHDTLARWDGSEWAYHLPDALGSVRQVADGTGAVVSAREWTPYGVEMGTAQAGLGYTGEHWDRDVGLLYLRARWYDGTVGRFTQRDPVKSEPPYIYVHGNPVNRADPSGMCELLGDFECWEIYKRIIILCPECAEWKTQRPDGTIVKLHENDIQYLRVVLENLQSAGWGVTDPLTPAQWGQSKLEAQRFQIPVELVAGTVAVEIEHDTDWYDYYLDVYLQMLPLIVHYCPPLEPNDVWVHAASDWFLVGYEHYWGALGERGPGNGVANVHILTAKQVENYFTKNYPGDPRLPPAHDIYSRMADLVTDSGSIHYTAAILRMLADKRTGVMSPHDSLSDTDMEVIYSAYRSDLKACYGSEVGYRNAFASPKNCFGSQILDYLVLYRAKLQQGE